jgi:hypothetical protein
MTLEGIWSDGLTTWDTIYTWDGTPSSDATWIMNLDLDGDGVYDTNIAMYAVNYYCTRGRVNFINAASTGFERIATGVATITLDNSDGRFDSNNTSSPYYPNLVPGKLVRITTRIAADVYNVFAGVIYDIQLQPGRNENTAVITLRDGMHLLTGTPASNTIDLSKQVSEAVSEILTNLSYPTLFGTDVNKSSGYINTYWSQDKSASKLIHELAELELGQYYIGADGQFVFQGRHTNNAVAATLEQENLLYEIVRPQPWEVNKDIVRVTVNQVVATQDTNIYSLGVALYVGAGDDITLWASYSYNNNPAFAEGITVAFTANSNSDGTGVDLTADFDISETEFSNSAKLVCSNNGLVGGYVATIDITGLAYVQSDPFFVEAGSGNRLFTLNSDYTQDKLKADEYSDFLLEELDTNTTIPVLIIDALPSVQFPLEVQSVITVNIPQLNINNVDYRISGIEHEWLAGTAQATRTIIYTEPFLDPGAAGTFTFTMPFDMSL